MIRFISYTIYDEWLKLSELTKKIIVYTGSVALAVILATMILN